MSIYFQVDILSLCSSVRVNLSGQTSDLILIQIKIHTMSRALFFSTLLLGAFAAPGCPNQSSSIETEGSTSCFPFGGAKLPKDYSAPSASRSQWWCPQSEMYGFLGFSYPLEEADCSDYTNSYDAINSDFARMKKDFGATMVRVYAPECRKSSVWENLLKAAVNNNMGVIPQVWWGFEVRGPRTCLD